MSLSPFKSNISKSTSAPQQPATDRLSLSQALIITAGLAGLLGLCGGAAIRFSLASSSNTRFLSPLQTFPEVSDWASNPSQNAAGSQTREDIEPGGINPPTDEAIRIPTFDAMEPLRESTDSSEKRSGDQSDLEDSRKEAETVDIATFDTFAARDETRTPPLDPLETLKKGPNWPRPE
ncbi:MAG: hypothetical protein WBB01_25610 [Phormidesmis sp.]